MPQQGQPASEQFYDMSFPQAGISSLKAFSDATPAQMPNGEYGRTAQDGTNVRTFEALTQRGRGGSRPGIEKYVTQALVADWIVQEINTIVIVDPSAV